MLLDIKSLGVIFGFKRNFFSIDITIQDVQVLYCKLQNKKCHIIDEKKKVSRII